MKRIILLSIILILIIPNLVKSQSNWQSIHTVKEACDAWPEQMKSIFTNLDLSLKELAPVKRAIDSEHLVKACEALLAYYHTSPSILKIESSFPDGSNAVLSEGDTLLQSIFTFQRVTGKVPRDSEEHLVWSHTGPEDDIEWAWALNRHYPLNNLINLYQATGEDRYIDYMDGFIKDWIIQSWPYPGVKSNTAMWRGLEVSFRAKVWAKVFFGYMNNPGISPATRLLILSALPDHAHYARHFHGKTNWLTMEMSGLATVAAYWLELGKSKEWFDYSIEAMTSSMKDQVYPDGVQTELSSHYHRASEANFSTFKTIIEQAGHELPAFYTRTLEEMWNYLVKTMRPDGHGLLNNDSDLDYSRDNTLKAAAKYHRGDWEYIATNGESGEIPEGSASFFFPWAGQMVSRSGFDKDAHWSFFDVGPWGSGHQHNDKLHLSVSAYGRDLLVDGGRFAYRGAVAKKFREYALSSRSHNVLLIDGNGQSAGPRQTNQPLSDKDYEISKDHDYATGSFNRFKNLDGVVKHSRSVYYKRGQFWVVIDQVATDRPRHIEALWHWHPDCIVQKDGNEVYSANENGNLQIIPVGNQDWKIDMIKGREPDIQGWYSPEYNKYSPNVASVYSTDIKHNDLFAWILFPSKKGRTKVEAKILERKEKSVTLEVKLDDEIQEINVPLREVNAVLDNTSMDGYRGIWFELGQKFEYGDKYSGGLGTYTAKHVPLAIYAPEADKTFFVYGGTKNDTSRHLLCMIGAYDHQSGKVSKPTVVCDKRGVIDPHDNPSLMIDDDGYIWVFVSGRGRKRPGFKYRSRDPFSIDQFDIITEEEMTYPQPWNTKNGFLHLFTKYTGVRQLYWERSQDGVHWSDDQLLAAIPQNAGEKSGHYQISATWKEKMVGTFFNRHPQGNVDRRTDLYYLQTNDLGTTWTDVTGSTIEIPLTQRNFSARVIDFYTKEKNIYLKDMGFSDQGYPVGLFIRSNGHEPGPENAPYEWFIVQWNGEEWELGTITSSDHNYDMGSLYLGADKWRVVGPTTSADESPQPWGVGGELEIWESMDQGKSWIKGKQITHNSRYNHSYVRRPLNYKSPFCFFWADGDPHHFSSSRLYFGDFEGHVWKLPDQMVDEWETPVRLND